MRCMMTFIFRRPLVVRSGGILDYHTKSPSPPLKTFFKIACNDKEETACNRIRPVADAHANKNDWSFQESQPCRPHVVGCA
eukprot:SAG11_NODE_24422_length_373_cov_1.138686_1_plen_80_part_10